MKYNLRLLESDDYDDEEDSNYEGDVPTISVEEVKKHRVYLSKVAQQVYDDWDESDQDTYAGGGICHLIADELSSYLNNLGVETATISSNFEQHVYCVSKLIEGVYSIDIHWSYYETGGGFSWKKIPNVVFSGEEIEFYCIDSDYREWEKLVDYQP